MTQTFRPPTRASQHTRNARRGFTVVELLMATSIFAISATGVLALQIVSSRANTHAKDLAAATQLARSWQDRLAMDALLWTGKSRWLITQTEWVEQVDAIDNTWFLPANDVAGTFGPAADARGAFVDGSNQDEVYFCTHVRLTKLFSNPGAQLVRSEVRVFWPKGFQEWNGGADYCGATADVLSVGAATDDFNFVYHTTTIRETPEF